MLYWESAEHAWQSIIVYLFYQKISFVHLTIPVLRISLYKMIAWYISTNPDHHDKSIHTCFSRFSEAKIHEQHLWISCRFCCICLLIEQYWQLLKNPGIQLGNQCLPLLLLIVLRLELSVYLV